MKADILINVVHNIIKKELGNPVLNGELIAKELGMSRMHLHRQLKLCLDKNASELILAIRMQYARQQLIDTDTPIKRIAFNIGYLDPKYFAKVFKKYNGVSPTQYRKRLA